MARADDHPTFLYVSHHINEFRETPPKSDDDTTLMGDEDSVQQALETTNPQETRDTRTQPPSKSPAWTGTKAPKTSMAGEGGYGDYSNDSDDSGNNLPPLDVLMVRAIRKRAMANAGDKPSTTTMERPGGSISGQEGSPNSEQAVTAPVVAGESPDMPIRLDDNGDVDDDDSNEDADDEYNDDDGGQDDGSKKSCTAPPHTASLNARSSPSGEVQIQHYSLPTSDARLEYMSTAPTQAFSPRPEAAFDDNTGPENGKSSPPSDSVIPSNTEDGLPTEFPPESPTEEASDCIYQDGDNGCREPGHGTVKAPLGDAVRHYRSSALQVPEQTEDPDAPNIVRPTASLISEPAAGGLDYVRRLRKEQQLQYAPLRPDARLQYVSEADQHG